LADLADLNQSDLKVGGEHFEESKRRAVEEQIRYYVPYDDPGYQLDFHKSPAFIRFGIGGNKGGKTHCHAAEHIWWATGTHPYLKTPKPPVHLRFVTVDVEDGIKKVTIPKFKEMVRRDSLLGGRWDKAYSKESRTLHFENGSTEEFMSYDQDADKFSGADRHLIGFDEPPPKDIFDECLPRLIKYKGRVTMTLTPANLNARNSWIFDLYLQALRRQDKNYIELFDFDPRLNRSLDKEWLEDFWANLPEDQILPRKEGKFPQFAGLVFKTFSRAKNVIKAPALARDVTRFIGVDPHTRKPNAVLYLGVNREGEYFAYDEIFEHGGGKEMVDLIKAKIGEDKIECNWMDDYGRNVDQYKKGKQVSIWQEFLDPDGDGSNKGIYCLTIKMTEKLWEIGIRRIRNLLGLDEVYQKPRLFISEECPLLIHEFETCIYEDFRYRDLKPLKETVKKKDIHLIPCLMFMLLGGAEYVKLRSPEGSEYKSPYPYLNKYRK